MNSKPDIMLEPGANVRACKHCGCTDENACVMNSPTRITTCCWVAADVCSACDEGLIRSRARALSFDMLRESSVARVEKSIGHLKGAAPKVWLAALSSASGEACNLLDNWPGAVGSLDSKLAELIFYVVLIAARLDIDLPVAIIRVYNEVSGAEGSNLKL